MMFLDKLRGDTIEAKVSHLFHAVYYAVSSELH